jgi:pyruvate/2-oxoglutarate dehydrogenase complex dihydrolipoamide dehydrogenase (E3) component
VAVAYDLVIIGGTWLARQIAAQAAALKARVALVEPQDLVANLMTIPAIYQQAIQASGAISSDSTSRWLQAAVRNLDELNSLEVLAALGIDVIPEMGEFCRLPHLAFVVKNRPLRAQSYLIAVGNTTIAPKIAGIEDIRYYTPETLKEQIFAFAPQRKWVVIGGNNIGVEFAQILHQLGARVTLVLKSDRLRCKERNSLLPQEDPEITALLQAQLEAQGIQVITQAEVNQVKQIEETKWVQAGNQAIEADEIFLAVRQQPQVANLNLAGVGVELQRQGIKVNRKLQTTNSRIYACSSAQASVGVKEGQIALHNALFWNRRAIDCSLIPTFIGTQPPLARIGLTEAQSKTIYGKKALVLQQDLRDLTIAQISSQVTGTCKVIVHLNGKILGAQIIGTGAMEIMQAIAFHMQQGGKIQDLAVLNGTYPSYAEMFILLNLIWQTKTLNRQKWRAECLDRFFDWRRSWSK